ncbi:6233_t:CDS:1, partial [Paraglomus occultum]
AKMYLSWTTLFITLWKIAFFGMGEKSPKKAGEKPEKNLTLFWDQKTTELNSKTNYGIV